MNVEELPSVKDVVSSLEEVRKRVSDADIVDASRSALTSAREAVADGWPRRRRASRWPWVAVVILGMTVLGLALLTPTFRRWTAGRGASAGPGDDMGAMGDVTPPPVLPVADETGDQFYPAERAALYTAPLPVGGTE